MTWQGIHQIELIAEVFHAGTAADLRLGPSMWILIRIITVVHMQRELADQTFLSGYIYLLDIRYGTK